MAFTNHVVLRCRTCKRRHVSSGPRKGDLWADAKRLGWVFLIKSPSTYFEGLLSGCFFADA
jgi:hypothetical protein